MAVVTYIKTRNQNQSTMRNSIRYAINPNKTTMENGTVLMSGKDCNPWFAYDEFMATKNLFKKANGMFYYHYVQSFSPKENITPEEAHKIGLELAEFFKGHEVVVGTHLNEEHIHTHLIVNSVSHETGKKLHMDNKSIFRIRDYSDKICMVHGLSVLEKSEPKKYCGMNSGEYRCNEQNKGWKRQLTKNIENAMRICDTKDELIKFMEQKNYSVKWTDSRKNITYTCPNGRKCCDDKLHNDKFLKSNMELEFSYRQTYYKEKKTGWEDYEPENVYQPTSDLSEAGRQILRLAKYIEKMNQQNEDDTDELQTLMVLTALSFDLIYAFVEALTAVDDENITDEVISDIIEEINEQDQNQGFGGMSM